MSSIDDIWASMNESTSKSASKGTKKTTTKSKVKEVAKTSGGETSGKVLITYDEMKLKISRDVNASAEEDVAVRRKALQRLLKLLFEDHDMSSEDYGKVFRDIGKSIFKRFADPVEKCRELSQRGLTQALVNHQGRIGIFTTTDLRDALLRDVPPNRLPVHEVDERYSTTEAQRSGAADVDAASAAVILEQYLHTLSP